MRTIVLIGAGHAHVEVLRRFGADPLPGWRLVLITRDLHTPYSGMLPSLVRGRYRFEDAHIDTRPLAGYAEATLHHASAIGIDRKARRVHCNDGDTVPYDVLSLDIGAVPAMANIPGAAEHAIPVKPIDRFLDAFAALRERARAEPRHIAMVGGGASGVEILLTAERVLRRDASRAGHDPAAHSFSLVTASPVILPEFPGSFRRRFEETLRERNVEIVTGRAVSGVKPGRLILEVGEAIQVDDVLWAIGAGAPAWLGNTGLPLDEAGFVQVDETLKVRGTDAVFAAGDVMSFGPRPLPKSGVYAVRAGPVLAGNLRRAATGETLSAHHPQADALYLVTTGEDYAVGTRNGWSFSGRWVWWLKDWIDRRFMRRYQHLP